MARVVSSHSVRFENLTPSMGLKGSPELEASSQVPSVEQSPTSMSDMMKAGEYHWAAKQGI